MATRPSIRGREPEADGDSDEDYVAEDVPPPEWYDDGLDERDDRWMAKFRRGRKSDALLSCPACLSTVCVDCQRHEHYTTQYRAMLAFNCRVDRSKPTCVSEKTKHGGGKGSRGKGKGRGGGAGPQGRHEDRATLPAASESVKESGFSGGWTGRDNGGRGEASERLGQTSAISTSVGVDGEAAMETDRGEDERSRECDEVDGAAGGADGRGSGSSNQALGHVLHASTVADADVVYPVLCEGCGTQVGVMDADEVYHFFNVLPSNA